MIFLQGVFLSKEKKKNLAKNNKILKNGNFS